jgi:hypothetical protein
MNVVIRFPKPSVRQSREQPSKELVERWELPWPEHSVALFPHDSPAWSGLAPADEFQARALPTLVVELQLRA